MSDNDDVLRLLGDLLAIMHRDGGHHTADVGLEQSIADAQKRYYELLVRIRDLESGLEKATKLARNAAFEDAARKCEKRAEHRFEAHGYTEPDTNASYYVGEYKNLGDSLDEEDLDCAAAIRAMKEPSDG